MNRVSPIVVIAALVFMAPACPGQGLPEMPKPQKEHEWLGRFVGEWESVAEAPMGPGQPPMKCEGTQRARMLGGFWMIAEGKADMMGTPVESVLTLGYNPEKKSYVGTWTDSVHNYLWHYVGQVSEDGQSLTLNTEGPSFTQPGQKSKYREVIEFKDKDHYVFSSLAEGPDGNWVTFMTANFRRAKSSE